MPISSIRDLVEEAVTWALKTSARELLSEISKHLQIWLELSYLGCRLRVCVGRKQNWELIKRDETKEMP